MPARLGDVFRLVFPTINLESSPHQMVKCGGHLEMEFARNTLQLLTQIIVKRTELREVKPTQTVHVMRDNSL